MGIETKEPIEQAQIGETNITLLGTAHVSQASVDQVNRLLKTGDYDAVAVELCDHRYEAIINPDSLAEMDLFQVLKEGKGMMVAANLALGAYQQRIAEQMGIEPGAEQRAAIHYSEQNDCSLLLVDRNIGITLRRVAANVSWWKRFGLFSGIFAGLFTSEKVDEKDIEQLKEGDMLETTFAEFAQDRQDLFKPLIDERDQYMAARLIQEIEKRSFNHVLLVIGAGHLAGTLNYLKKHSSQAGEEIHRLEQLPKGSRWPKIIPWFIVALIVIGFGIGFSRDTALGFSLIIDWIVINGALSALGALLAGGHILTILTAFVAAPITSLNPTIGAGIVTAGVEIYLRKPRVGDFSALRHDVTNIKGWWGNRVSRTLMVFLFSSLGSAIGTYVAGFRIMEKLI